MAMKAKDKLPLKTRIDNFFLALTPEQIKAYPEAKGIIADIKLERATEVKTCETCKNRLVAYTSEPCSTCCCSGVHWQPRQPRQPRQPKNKVRR